MPFFPCEHTDGGECGAILIKVCPENKQGSRKSQRSEIFGKEERQAQRARRQAQRAACHGALARRGAEGRNRCRAAVRLRTTGFPLPHGNFFRQLERNFVNSIRSIRTLPASKCRYRAGCGSAGQSLTRSRRQIRRRIQSRCIRPRRAPGGERPYRAGRRC